LVVFDLTDRMQQLLQDNEGVAGMGGHQQGRIACEAHQGILELRADETLRRCDGLGGHRNTETVPSGATKRQARSRSAARVRRWVGVRWRLKVSDGVSQR